MEFDLIETQGFARDVIELSEPCGLNLGQNQPSPARPDARDLEKTRLVRATMSTKLQLPQSGGCLCTYTVYFSSLSKVLFLLQSELGNRIL